MKKKFKLSKLIALTLAATISLGACGGTGSTSTAETEPAPSADAEASEEASATPEELVQKLGEVTETDIEGVSIINLVDETKPNPAKDRSNASDTVVVAISTSTQNRLLPVYYGSNYDKMATELIFGTGLISNDHAGNIIFDDYAQAESYALSDDKLTYTFKIKEGLVCSDGTPINAYDVEHTFTMMADPSYDGRNVSAVDRLVGYKEYNQGDAEKVEGINVIDDHTISFTFTEVSYDNIFNFGVGTMSKELYPMAKGEFEKVKQQMNDLYFVGSGPYVFSKLEPDQYLEFDYNENFQTEKTTDVKKIIMAFASKDTMFDEFGKGTYDILTQTPANNDNLERIKSYGVGNIRSYPANTYGFMAMNLKDPILEDVKVRQALTYGFDRQTFVDAYYNGYATVCNSPISRVSWAYSPVPNEYEYSVEKANALLDEAGWVMGSNGYRSKDGTELSLKWDTYTDSKYVEFLIPMLTENWKQIGVKVEANLMDFNAMIEKTFDKQDFQLTNLAWALTTDPSSLLTTFGSQYNKPGDNNMGSYSNEVFDENVKLANASFDQDERKALYANAVNAINEDAPYVFINQSNEWTLVNDRLKNFNSSPFVLWHTVIMDVELD
ncbi:MAG: ABC transporter substrate-binding protein [Lachnospirales bacterium]